jgi:hypothetical protein
MTTYAMPPGAPPADLIVTTAQGLGYWPGASLVLVLVSDKGEHCVSARCDLADIAESPAGWREYLGRVIAASGAAAGDVLIFDPAADPHWQASVVAVEAMKDAGLPVRDVVVARRGEEDFAWISLMDSADLPRPDIWQRQSWPHDPDRPSAWTLTRGDLERELTPSVPGWLAGTDSTLDETHRDLAVADILARLCDGDDSGDETLLLTALTDLRVRDTVIWEILQRPRVTWAPAAERLVPTVRRTAPGHVAPVATLLGLLRWQGGDGTRAAIALDRALADDPDYTLAQLLDGCLRSAITPASWREGMLTLTRDQCRRPG